MKSHGLKFEKFSHTKKWCTFILTTMSWVSMWPATYVAKLAYITISNRIIDHDQCQTKTVKACDLSLILLFKNNIFDQWDLLMINVALSEKSIFGKIQFLGTVQKHDWILVVIVSHSLYQLTSFLLECTVMCVILGFLDKKFWKQTRNILWYMKIKGWRSKIAPFPKKVEHTKTHKQYFRRKPSLLFSQYYISSVELGRPHSMNNKILHHNNGYFIAFLVL